MGTKFINLCLEISLCCKQFVYIFVYFCDISLRIVSPLSFLTGFGFWWHGWMLMSAGNKTYLFIWGILICKQIQFVYNFVYFWNISRKSYLLPEFSECMVIAAAGEGWCQRWAHCPTLQLCLFLRHIPKIVSAPPFLNGFQFWLFCWLEQRTVYWNLS